MKKIIRLNNNNKILLKYDNWDDFGYKTLFTAYFINKLKNEIRLGSVSVGMENLDLEDSSRTIDFLNDEIKELDDKFFSLGTEEYYKNLNSIVKPFKVEILEKLNDVVYNKAILAKVENEKCFRTSLTRGITDTEIRGRFTRLVNDEKELTEYRLNLNYEGTELSFYVNPDGNIPSNIHAIIGSNGVGKTSLLKRILDAYSKNELREDNTPPNLIYCSFSIFDTMDAITYQDNKNINIISLTSNRENINQEIVSLYKESFENCQKSSKKLLLDKMYSILSVNPSMKELKLEELSSTDAAESSFRELSSGHKIILLTITKLVEIMEEKTLLIFDEPELHLHPTLLSTLMTALSELLKDRNGMAILATHSPIVLQEISSSCVYKVSKLDGYRLYSRLDTNTLGESIDKLTREVFSYEVDKTGFFKKLKDDVKLYENIEELIEQYDSMLGSEALAIASALYYLKGVE